MSLLEKVRKAFGISAEVTPPVAKLKKVELKIKSKSLMEEARIIRKEERELKESFRSFRWNKMPIPQDRIEHLNSIHDHRVWAVRNEARATHLARAFLKGTSYKRVEQKRERYCMFCDRILPRIHTLVNKYGDRRVDISEIKSWAGV